MDNYFVSWVKTVVILLLLIGLRLVLTWVNMLLSVLCLSRWVIVVVMHLEKLCVLICEWIDLDAVVGTDIERPLISRVVPMMSTSS